MPKNTRALLPFSFAARKAILVQRSAVTTKQHQIDETPIPHHWVQIAYNRMRNATPEEAAKTLMFDGMRRAHAWAAVNAALAIY